MRHPSEQEERDMLQAEASGEKWEREPAANGFGPRARTSPSKIWSDDGPRLGAAPPSGVRKGCSRLCSGWQKEGELG
jgi:hypothetical protein